MTRSCVACTAPVVRTLDIRAVVHFWCGEGVLQPVPPRLECAATDVVTLPPMVTGGGQFALSSKEIAVRSEQRRER